LVRNARELPRFGRGRNTTARALFGAKFVNAAPEEIRGRTSELITKLLKHFIADPRWPLLTPHVIIQHVIVSFGCVETERLFRAEMTRRFPPSIQRSARRKLLALHAATEVRQMAVPPGNRMELLKGTRKGQYSIRVNDQWRVCFPLVGHWTRTMLKL
jgi:proteic killer suppression protein